MQTHEILDGILHSPAEERFDRLTRIALRVFQTPISVIAFAHEGKLWYKSRQGLDHHEMPLKSAFSKRVIASSTHMIIEDTNQVDDFADNPLVRSEPHVRFFAGWPISLNEKTVGCFAVMDKAPRKLVADDPDILRDLALICESELLVERLGATQQELISERDAWKRKTLLDPLTGTWGRQAILQLLERQLKKHPTDELSIIMLDLDRLKFINEQHGYETGSAVLREAAQTIRRAMRPRDAVGRLEDDRFLVIAAGMTTVEAKQRSEKAISMVAESGALHGKQRLPFRFSIGIAGLDDGDDRQELVITAEKALRRAQNRGGGCVEIGR